jgi:APA family basic amino acid/polyamine antiporter
VAVLFSTVLALGLIYYVANQAESDIVLNLASVTALLLLGVFTIVNVACLALRVDGRESKFKSPGYTPALAAAACLFLVGPWVDRDTIIYQIAGGLLLVGVGLWVITWLINRGSRAQRTGFRDIDHMEDDIR